MGEVVSLFDIKSAHLAEEGLSQKDIIQSIERGRHYFDSLISYHQHNQWQKIHHFDLLSEAIASKVLTTPKSFQFDSLFYHWCLKDLPSPKGAYNLAEIIRLYQKAIIGPESLIRHPTIKDWKALAEQRPFDSQSIAVLFQIPKLKGLFKERKGPRTTPNPGPSIKY